MAEKLPYYLPKPQCVTEAADEIIQLLADKKMSYANADQALNVARIKIKDHAIVEAVERIENGKATINDVREEFGLLPIEGGDRLCVSKEICDSGQ